MLGNIRKYWDILGYIGIYWDILGYIGIMEKKMETTIMGYIGIIRYILCPVEAEAAVSF